MDTARADSVVFLVNSLALPKKSELASDHRIERLEFEKVLGRSLMYLIAAVARETVMRHKDEFGVAVFDECWWLTSSDEGLELLLELMRDGRKHNAAAYVGSHDPDDIGLARQREGRHHPRPDPAPAPLSPDDAVARRARTGVPRRRCHRSRVLDLVTHAASPRWTCPRRKSSPGRGSACTGTWPDASD